MSDILKCIGCGAPLQSEDKNKPGFVPEHNMFRDDVICRRCFRLKNYNEVQDVGLESEDFLKLLSGLADKRVLSSMSWMYLTLKDHLLMQLNVLSETKIILAANKLDLLPKQINKRRVKEWLNEQQEKYGLEADDVVLISAEKAGA